MSFIWRSMRRSIIARITDLFIASFLSLDPIEQSEPQQTQAHSECFLPCQPERLRLCKIAVLAFRGCSADQTIFVRLRVSDTFAPIKIILIDPLTHTDKGQIFFGGDRPSDFDFNQFVFPVGNISEFHVFFPFSPFAR